VDDRVWKNISILLGVVCALLFGVAGALLILGHRGTPSTASPAPLSSDIAGATTPGDTALPSGAVLQSNGPTLVPGPTPSPGKPSPASITFTNLALDSANDANGTARTFTFTSDGAGPVTYAVTKTSAGGTSKMCAKVDSSGFTCTVKAMPGFLKGSADGPHNTWVVTLVGYGSSKPTVDVTFTWPASTAKIQLSHGRLQGSSTQGVSDALNGFSASFKPRVGGALNVQATWTDVTTDASLSLFDATSPPNVTVDQRQYKSATYINPAFTANVDPTKTYLVELRNLSADSQRPDLTAQISFP
jgi:hypothetical protein